MLHDVDAVINRFLTVCEDVYDNRQLDTPMQTAYLKVAIALYVLRLHALRCEGKLRTAKHDDDEMLALYLELLPDDGVPQGEREPWYELLDALPKMGMPYKKQNGDDVFLEPHRSLFNRIEGLEHILKALRKKIANVRRINQC